MNFCIDSKWRYAEKIFVAVIAPSVLSVIFSGSLINVAAEPNLQTKTKIQIQTITPDNSAIAPPALTTLSTFQAVITQYSRTDSCHTVKNGKCIMASGRAVYVGAAACPGFLNLGTRVSIDGKSYTCEDRYAKWLDQKRGLPTVDIFVEKNPYGNAVKLVTIES